MFAPNPVLSVLGDEGRLGRDGAAILVYFGETGDSANFAPLGQDNPGFWTAEDDWTTDQKAIVLAALDEVESAIDVTFQVTTNQSSADLDLIKNSSIPGEVLAPSFQSDSGGQNVRRSSLVLSWEEDLIASDDVPFDKGSLKHEFFLGGLGFALGLGSTHNDNSGSEVLRGLDTENRFWLGPDFLNDGVNSVMSANSGYSFYDTGTEFLGNRGNFGAWDIAALQEIYGAAVNNAGDTVYVIETGFLDDLSYQTIWDTGGIDAITTDSFEDAVIDLRAATLDYDPETSGGPVSLSVNSVSEVQEAGFTIAAGVVIENAYGQDGDDRLVGNDAANLLLGRGGADQLLPGLGFDTVDGGADQDEIIGTARELNWDRIESVTGRDRIFVKEAAFDLGDMSVTQLGSGDYRLSVDGGAASSRFNMLLDSSIGAPGSGYQFVVTPRGDDTIIEFVIGDDYAGNASTDGQLAAQRTGYRAETLYEQYGVIETPGDVDWFSVLPLLGSNGADTAFEVRSVGADAGTLSAPQVSLYRQDTGALIGGDAGSGAGGTARFVLSGGAAFDTYYVAVSGGNGATGSYTVRAVQADDHPDEPYSYSPFFAAGYLQPNDDARRMELETVGDQDYLGIELTAGVSYTFTARGAENRFGATTDTRLTLRREDGSFVAQDNNSGPGSDASLNYTANTAGTHYLVVDAGSSAADRRIGYYDVEMRVQDDVGDSQAEADYLSLNTGQLTRYFETWNDEDWFQVSLVAGQSYSFGASGHELWLRLYSPDGTFIDISQSSVLGPADIDYTASETGFYYLNLEAKTSTSTGDYFLTANGTEGSPPPGGSGGTVGNPALAEDLFFFNAGTRAVGMIDTEDSSWSGLSRAGSGWIAIATGEFDRDGYADVLWYKAATKEVGRFDIEESGITWRGIGTGAGAWEVEGTLDYDGDGDADILWVNGASGGAGVYRMEDGAPVWENLGTAGAGWSVAGTGDFDGNGREDVLWLNEASGALGQFSVEASGVVWEAITTLGSGWEVVATGDLDFDFRDDVLVFNAATRALGRFDFNEDDMAWVGMGTSGAGWAVEGTGDFNGDSQDDVLWRNANTNAVGQYQMGEDGAWDWVGITTAGSAWEIV